MIDEAFWQSGLRGLDGKAVLTQDGLEPGTASVTCYGSKGRIDMAATADLIAARHKLRKALQATEPGPLAHGLLQSVGLTAEECRNAARLERRRLRDPGLLPGMGPAERRRHIDKVLPPHGQPWAPPGRCATMWLILAEALENEHDAAGAVLANELTEHGTVRALKLRWRGRLRGGWAAEVPVLHLDATLREELVRPYLQHIAVREPVTATTPHVRVRQVLGSPTTAKALTPGVQAPERDQKTAAHHLRDLMAYVRVRACELRGSGGDADLLVVGQKAAIDALRAAGLPRRVDAVHFNGLSGLDRWGGVGGLIVLGRTLPAPATVEALCAALTGQMPIAAAEGPGWWYGNEERRIRLAGGRTHAVPGEVHADPTAEAIRWSICEAELIQAMGRGRGVNRTAENPLQIDLMTDVVLPVTVAELVDWQDLRPARRDLMAARGVVLENAADMAALLPRPLADRDAARKDGRGVGQIAIIGSSIIAKCPTPRWWSATGPRGRGTSCVARSSISASSATRRRGSPADSARSPRSRSICRRAPPRATQTASPISPAGCMQRWLATSLRAVPRSMRSTPGSRPLHRPAGALCPISFPSNQWRPIHDGRRHPALRARPVQQHSACRTGSSERSTSAAARGSTGSMPSAGRSAPSTRGSRSARRGRSVSTSASGSRRATASTSRSTAVST